MARKYVSQVLTVVLVASVVCLASVVQVYAGGGLNPNCANTGCEARVVGPITCGAGGGCVPGPAAVGCSCEVEPAYSSMCYCEES